MRKHIDRIELDKISFVHNGETSALWNNLSLYFLLNKLNLIIGPSGCGKSSILYLLSGIIPHFWEGTISGNLYYGGKNVLDAPPNIRAGEISMVFQDPEAQFVTFTVEDEVAFGLENACVPKESIDRRIEEALNFARIPDLRKRNLSELSGGEKQKAAIACVLALDSPIIAMDEPTANLDAQSRNEIFELIKKLAQDKNKTIILIEHNIEGIIDAASHFVILRSDRTLELAGDYNTTKTHIKKFYPFLDKTDLKSTCFSYSKSSAQEILKFDNVSFSYDGQEPKKLLFDKLSCSIARGDFVFLTGSNGAGKSTLINLLFKVIDGYTGEIFFDSEQIKSIPKQKLYKRLGWVFQNPEWQFVTNSVLSEMEFSLKNIKMNGAEKKQRIEKTLKRFCLDAEQEKSPFLLSQGQKRRLSVAIMLLTNQEMLILDEPTYGQDYENRMELMDMMMELNGEGVTILMITHDNNLIYECSKKHTGAFRHLRLENGGIKED